MMVNGDKDASVLVVEPAGNEELIVVRPKERQESSRSPGTLASGKSEVLPSCTEHDPFGTQYAQAAWSVPEK